ncbi:MAG: hypothetical protein FJ128_00510 [Deltaproteobacteria bacterium]|nr:hypothetical protein [Deltaproteobacteria bacterium]
MATPKKLFLSATTGLLALSLIFLSGLTLLPVQADVDELALVQQAIRVKGGKWRAEENEISRLPKEERKKRLGLIEAAPGISRPAASRCIVVMRK